MALKDLTDRDAVLRAIAKFDERGRDAFSIRMGSADRAPTSLSKEDVDTIARPSLMLPMDISMANLCRPKTSQEASAV